MIWRRVPAGGGLTAACLLALSVAALADTTILNVSYDVSRELYKDINPAFIADWKAKTGETIVDNQSHGGSSKQAISLTSGLEADVVTMNQAPDIDILVERGGFVAADWRKRLPHEATPYITTTAFLVRKGNPKAVKDWDDLVRPGLQVIVPNPKTSGNGRYTYLAAWGYALQKSKDESVFENEAIAVGAAELGTDKFDIVYPSLSIEAAPAVALVDKVVDKRDTRKGATAYLEFLFPPQGQEIIAKHAFRPRDEVVLHKFADRFPAIKTFTVEKALGGWTAVQAKHFADGAIYDQIVVKR
jgi:sulfate/thiosulfate transport system substrate-binding protein